MFYDLMMWFAGSLRSFGAPERAVESSLLALSSTRTLFLSRRPGTNSDFSGLMLARALSLESSPSCLLLDAAVS